MHAVVTAGGRISGPLAEETGQTIKCLIEFNGQRLIDHVLNALRGAEAVENVCVVGPPEIKDSLGLRDGDLWFDEADTGTANFLRAIKPFGDEEKVVFSTSDLPFLTSAAIDDLVGRCATGYGIHYPIFTREEVRVRFPYEANSYMALRDGDMTGSSVMVIEPRRVLDREAEINELFNARKDFLKLARLVGFGLGLRLGITMKTKLRLLSVDRILRRFTKVAGFPVEAVRGCDPVIGFDIDHERDWAEALKHIGVVEA